MTTPAMDGPDQAGGVHHGGIQSDGAAEILAALDHLHHERLPRWHVEGVNQALRQTQPDDFVDVDDLRQG